MAKQRAWVSGGTYHITNRGVRKESIFFNDMDKHMFVLILSEVRYKYPFKLHAYCLMNNHFHLLIESTHMTPSKIMQIIQQRYSRYFNRTYQKEGHVFQSRFFASKIQDSDHLLNVSRYIHLNPVAAGLANKPSDYLWSSYNVFIRHSPIKDPLVETATTFSCYTHNPREMYKKYVER